VARPSDEEPEGLVYQPGLFSHEEETRLLDELESLRFDPIVLHGRAARRTGRHFGLDYDYGARTPKPGEPIPDWLLPVRARAVELAGHDPEELVEILVQRYPPGSTIGWHRDAPAFGTVVGVSLGGSSRLRFQRGKREDSSITFRTLR
jgi:alkylated DNA repair protein (DNA oxidative demethylase)